ncbi:anti-sigma factor [Nocardia sp. 2]|uniref:Regulator of SigK n=1 Tax=Nocardia acididurans TaxID=2802282 RepID=A0ABS1M249_9NOCA|nr:anti-sigma factor [Nocardia acididurans]MBL1074615.1 anti-sigma factor [Nocardia acididurans]
MTAPADPALLDRAHPYALDALTAFERRNLENQLAATDPGTRAAFTATVRDIRETLSLLTVFDAVPAPPELEEAIQRAIDDLVAAQTREQGRLAGHAGGWRSRRWRMVAAAAAVVVAIGAGAAVLAHRPPAGPAAVTAQSIQAQADTRTRTAPVASGGELIVYSSAGIAAAAVAFQDVAAPPPGRAYQLWLVPIGGTPVSAGVVATVPPSGSALVIRFGTQDTLALTLEPAGGSTQPTTTPIAALNLT